MLASWRNPIARIAAAQDGKHVERIAEDEKPRRVSWEKPSRAPAKETRLGRPLRLHGH